MSILIFIDVIEQFGEQLIELGSKAWRIQADGLSKTDYAGDGSNGSVASKTHSREDYSRSGK